MRALGRLAGAVGVLAAGLVLAAALFLARPGWFLGDRTAAAAFRHFGAAWAPSWSRLSFSAQAPEFRRHRYVLSAGDLCLRDARGTFSACFSEMDIAVVVFYARSGPVLERIDRLRAVAESLDADLTRKNAAPGGDGGGVPGFARAVPVRELLIDAPRFGARSGKSKASGSFRLELSPGAARPLSLSADAKISGPGGPSRVKASIAADSDLLSGGLPTRIALKARLEHSRLGRLRADVKARRQGEAFFASGSAEASVSTGPVRSVRLKSCEAAAPGPSEGRLSCRYELAWAKPVAEPLSGWKAATGLLRLTLRRDEKRFQAALRAGVDPTPSWLTVSGEAALHADGAIGRPLKSAALRHELKIAAETSRFEDAVAFLRDTRHAVPAPIHVMKGKVRLAVESRGDPRAERVSAGYTLSGGLSSPRQKLDFAGKGELVRLGAAGERRFEHDGELVLEDSALELPRLDVESLPKTKTDKRISAGETAAETKAQSARTLPLLSRLRVKTQKPLLLHSNLAKGPVPVALDVVAAYPPVSIEGKAKVGKFEVELFRRSATIDHFHVAYTSGSPVGVIDGLVIYRAPELTIGIKILGTTAKPRVEFSSVPPMKREDILALLIFGKSPDELDYEETTSLSNTETALESSAFGLLSLYLFGSTPVERVGYDSATRTASLKLRMPGGAALELGSDFDQTRELRLRKLLAPHWAIQSEISDQGAEGGEATTFLEWFNRY